MKTMSKDISQYLFHETVGLSPNWRGGQQNLYYMKQG